jgi:cyclin ccl1
MEYSSSTQHRKWLFTSQNDLDSMRERARSRAAKQQAIDISLRDEQVLHSYYALKLIELSRTMKLPDKVTCSACSYLMRFYAKKSCLEVDPQGIVLTCLYLAGKVEDCYVSAERIHSIGGISEEIILKSELVLLQGLEFDLQVHSVYKALLGGDQDCMAGAKEKMNRLLSTDAILLYTPGQLARYCLGRDEDDRVREAIGTYDALGLGAQERPERDIKRIDKMLKADRKKLQSSSREVATTIHK